MGEACAVQARLFRGPETDVPASDASEDCTDGQDADDLQQLLVELLLSTLGGLPLLPELDADVDQLSGQLWHSNSGQRADEESNGGKEDDLRERPMCHQDTCTILPVLLHYTPLHDHARYTTREPKRSIAEGEH